MEGTLGDYGHNLAEDEGQTDWLETHAVEGDANRDYAEEEYWRNFCGVCDTSPCRCVRLVKDAFGLDLTTVGDQYMWPVLVHAVHVEDKRRDELVQALNDELPL